MCLACNERMIRMPFQCLSLVLWHKLHWAVPEAAGVAVLFISEAQSPNWHNDFKLGVAWLEKDHDIYDVPPSCTEIALTFLFCDS